MAMNFLKKKWLRDLESWLGTIGALNWGLVQWFDFNLVTAWLSGMLVAVVYSAVGVAGVLMLLRKLKVLK